MMWARLQFLGGESVYTGPQTFHTINALVPDKCYLITVSAFVRDGSGGAGTDGDATAETMVWTPPSKALRASTRVTSAVSMRGLMTELAATREELERKVLAPAQRGVCAMTGFNSPAYTGGGDGFVQFTGVSDEISKIGAQAGTINCRRVSCQTRSRITMPFAAPLSGRLRVAVGDVREYHFIERTVRLHSRAPTMQFTDPRSPVQMVTVPLRGCRAFHGMRKPLSEDAAAKAKALETSLSTPFGSPAGEEQNTNSPCFRLECTSSIAEYVMCTASAAQAGVWIAQLNERSHATTLPERWQTAIKAAAMSAVLDNERRTRDRGVWEQQGVRDAFVASFLTSLPRSGAAPHFPLVFGTSLCERLPGEFAQKAMGPRPDMGLLPPHSAGAASELEFATTTDEGRASDNSWLVTYAENWDTDLEAVLSMYRGPSLPEAFSKALLFQVMYALGTARHAFGFHHNDLMTLSNIKLTLVPSQSTERQEFWCYVTNPGAIAMLPLIFRDQAATGVDGTLPGTRKRDRLFETIDGADACKFDIKGTPGADKPGYSEDVGDSLEALGAKSQASRARARTSWCLPSGSIDGLRPTLTNFEVASITRVQLDWWKAGFAFPNTAWRDDLQDLSMSLCSRLSGLMLEPAAQMEDLCQRMRAGVYRDRPLMALQHPWFADYSKVRAVHPGRRQTFIYAPLTIADIESSKSAPKKPPQEEQVVDLAKERAGETKAAEEEKVRNRVDSGSSGILAVLTPPPPWVELNDGTTLTIQWHAHQAHVRPLAPTMPYAPESFGLLQDRISVYSGPANTYALPAPVRGECHVFRVAAYYHALGWTRQSRPLTVGDCSGVV